MTNINLSFYTEIFLMECQKHYTSQFKEMNQLHKPYFLQFSLKYKYHDTNIALRKP